MSRIHQYNRTQNPFTGLAESVATSNVMFFGDAAMITGSLTTSSATASRWTVLGYEGLDTDGFTTSLPSVTVANGWNSAKAVTATGYFSMDTIPRWAAIQRTPSASSSTIFITIHVGP